MKKTLIAALPLMFLFAASAAEPPDGFQPGTVQRPPSIHQSELEEHNALGAAPGSPFPFLYAVRPEEWSEDEKGVASSREEALTRTIYGFLPYWVDTDISHIQWPLLTHVAFFSVELNTDGSGNISSTGYHGWPSGTYVQALINAAHANGVKVTLTATLMTSSSITTLLSSSANRQNCINNLLAQVQAGNADGVCIDFEGVPSAQKANLVTFMSELTPAFHSAIPGSHVSICTPAVDWSPYSFDYDQLALNSDAMFIMAYDYYYPGSGTAGPNSPLSSSTRWGEKAVEWTINDYITNGGSGNKSKFIVGLPYYGFEWPTASETVPSSTTGTGVSKTYSVAKPASDTYGREWDSYGNVPYYTRSGPYQCFYDDEESLGLKWEMVNFYGLGGTGMWALNYDNYDEGLWNTLEKKFTTNPGDMTGIKIGIDPGHGGTDPGAIGPSPIYLQEKDINLAGSLMLRDALQAMDASVYMTRTDDSTLSLATRYNYFNSVPVDRAESFHHNASGTASANYTGVHIYDSGAGTCGASARSKDMAAKTAVRLDDALNIGVVSANCPSPWGIDGIHGDDFAMVHYTSMPAMLTEASFISNPAEQALLATDARKCLIAGAIANGIEDHYGKTAEEPPCASNVCGGAAVISSFPYNDSNTTTGKSELLDGYSCPPSSGSEAGPEVIYLLEVPSAGTLVVTISDGTGVDIDPHLLSTCDPGSCIARADNTFTVFIQPGEYYLVCDTWTSASGTKYPGAYTLNVTFTPDTTAPTAVITSPTSGDTFSTPYCSMSLGGTASDNTGISRVTWTNDKGGNGTANGTTSWTANGIALAYGTNVLTATAYDGANNLGSDSLTVTCTDVTPPAAVADSLLWQNARWEWAPVTLDKNGGAETVGHYEMWRATTMQGWDFLNTYYGDIPQEYLEDTETPPAGSCYYYLVYAADAAGNKETPHSEYIKVYEDAVYSGTWTQGGAYNDCRGTQGKYKSAGTQPAANAWATWTFTPAETGSYAVSARYVAGLTNRTIARYTVVYYEDGSTTTLVDQTVNNCTWMPLGTYFFKAGTPYTVVLDNQATLSKVVIAEAVKWSR